MEIYPGEFYFKLTSTGNIYGEFTHRKAKSLGAESGIRIANETGDQRDFAGTYKVSWNEPDTGEGDFAELHIKHEDGNVCTRYELTWSNHKSGKRRFHGHGFVCDQILFGHYTAADTQGK